MRRVVCVSLPEFQTERIVAIGQAPANASFAVIAKGKGGNRLIAANGIARAWGIRAGMLLTEASAIEPRLLAYRQSEEEEAAALKRLAIGARRYGPWTGVNAPDGFWLDITGGAHLFGGEAPLLLTMQKGLARAGFSGRLAAAGTHAAAWAGARFARGSRTVVATGDEERACAAFSVRALDLGTKDIALLERFGLNTLGHLFSLPRETLRARFGAFILARLDRLLGREGESRSPLAYEPQYQERLAFVEPITGIEAVLTALRLLIAQIAKHLLSDAKCARVFTLVLLDTLGGGAEIAVKLSRSSADPKHVEGVFRERFSALESHFPEHLGFDAAFLEAKAVERTSPEQGFFVSSNAPDTRDVAAFVDRLCARLGPDAVTKFAFKESHIPENASVPVPILAKVAPIASRKQNPRPLLILPNPEPVTAIAELPDYPPRRLTWRRVNYRVTRAEGPERIETEWWIPSERPGNCRDYYKLEEEGGRRFWVYREGSYGDPDSPPRWFLHGLFA